MTFHATAADAMQSPCSNTRRELVQESQGWIWRALPSPFAADEAELELRDAAGGDAFGLCQPQDALEEARRQANERGEAVIVWDQVGEVAVATVLPDAVGRIEDPAQIALHGAGLEDVAADPRDVGLASSCPTCGAKAGGLCRLGAGLAPATLPPAPAPAPQAAPRPARAAAERPQAPRPVVQAARPALAPRAQPQETAAKLPTDSGNSPRDIAGNREMVRLLLERGGKGVTLAELREVSGFGSTPPASWVDVLGRKNGFAVQVLQDGGPRRFCAVLPG